MSKPKDIANSSLQIPSSTSRVLESQQTHTAYLKRLLERHAAKVDSVQSYTNPMEMQFHRQIEDGVYDIKKRDWSAEEERLKASRANTAKNTGDILRSKRQLEEELQYVQGQLQESSEGRPKMMTEEQRLAFLKKIEKEKKELQRKRQENARLLEEKRLQQERKAKEALEKQQSQKRFKKQQQIIERRKQMQQSQKKKQEEYKNQSLALKQKMKEKTLIDKIEQQYSLKQLESLEQRKKRLAEIRMLHRPIDKKQLDQHAQKFQKLKEQRIASAAQASSEKNTEKSAVNFYMSVFYKRVKEEQKIFLDKKNQEELSKRRENRDKLKKFSQEIRQNFKPTIDEKKVEEMKFRGVNFRSRSMSNAKSKDPESAQKLGLRYLQYSKLQADHLKLLAPSTDKDEQEEEEKNKKSDYLAQMREKNKNRTSESAHDLLNKLDKGSFSKEEKTKKILDFASKIEQAAKRKQELQKIGGNVLDDQLDELYLEAIQAKLGLLTDQ